MSDSSTKAALPAPQGSFLNFNSAQWKSAITVVMASALGPIIKGLLDRLGLHLDANSASDLLVTYGPTVAGVVIAVARRAHDAVLGDVVKILAARGQHNTAAIVQQAATSPGNATSAKMLSSPMVLSLLALILLAGCTTAPDGTKTINTPTVATVSADVNLVVGGFTQAITQVSNVPGLNVSSDTLNVAQASLSSIKTLATSIASASSTTAAQPLVAQLETYINAFVGALATVAQQPVCQANATCAAIGPYLTAATFLLPVIEVGVNMAVPAPPPASTVAAARATLAAPVPVN